MKYPEHLNYDLKAPLPLCKKLQTLLCRNQDPAMQELKPAMQELKTPTAPVYNTIAPFYISIAQAYIPIALAYISTAPVSSPIAF
ncbi:MAG: hypothetical protein ACRCVT_02695 [Leadbetterella sp.]